MPLPTRTLLLTLSKAERARGHYPTLARTSGMRPRVHHTVARPRILPDRKLRLRNTVPGVFVILLIINAVVITAIIFRIVESDVAISFRYY